MDSNERNEVVVKFQKKVIEALVWRSCLNCEDWMNVSEECKRFCTRPPCEVIVYGCSEWIAEIPF